MDLQTLFASIDLSNNDVLFAPTQAEIDCARANPDSVTIRFGRITRIGKHRAEYGRFDPPADTAHSITLDAPDWEGAILARQCLRDL